MVRFSLQDAEREVLSWFDPRRDARVEWSGYVRRVELAAAFEYLRDMWPGFFEVTGLDPQWAELYRQVVGDPVAAVVVSARGIDPLRIDGQAWVPDNGQDLAVAPERYGVVAMFDAWSGQRQVAMRGSASEFAGIPTARVSLGGTQVATPTQVSASGEPTASPEPTALTRRRLTRANLPEALRPTFRFYPLAPGSSRTWEWTSENGAVVWSAALVTETVEAAWLDGEMAVVESRLEWAWRAGPREHDPEPSTRVVRHVGLLFIAGARSDVSSAGGPDTVAGSSYRWPTPVPDSPFGREGVAIETDSGLFPEPDDAGLYQGAHGPVTVTAPAGTFEGCWRLYYVYGATAGSGRWVCPGLGVVAFGRGHAAVSHGGMEVAQLVRWTRAELPAE
jgi:hypothetical protein